jgi:hypothetical protein
MRRRVNEILGHVARWPLLLGGVICLGGGLLIAEAAGYAPLVVGVLLALGALLLGAWLWALATHTNPRHREPDDPPDTPIGPRHLP